MHDAPPPPLDRQGIGRSGAGPPVIGGTGNLLWCRLAQRTGI
jgi:hypothetical protein